MSLSLGNYAVSVRRRWHVLHVLLHVILALVVDPAAAQAYGDPCVMTDLRPGICRNASLCPKVELEVKKGQLSQDDIKRCSFDTFGEIICCPSDAKVGQPTPAPKPSTPFIFDSNSATTNATTASTRATSPPKQDTMTRLGDRPAVRACRIIDEGLGAALTTKVLDGTPVELGEYPHMAAIGYSRIGNDRGPYDFRCGGTLIDKRFVLTAAHCVNSRDSQPAIVRLGVTNFTDEVQMRNAVEVPIDLIHIHQNFSNLRKAHDIAIIELKYDVNFTQNIYPTCLHTEIFDPPADSKLFVTGWGQVSTRTRNFSSTLLKARLQIEPLTSCLSVYRMENVHLSTGHMCAHDPGFTKDACQGDSGGPLNLVVNEAILKYRVIGVISAGFSCASAIPGLFTRVAAYLNFIESIVWPL